MKAEVKTDSTAFFSIVVPCCDVEPYIRECLDSVLNQPFADWECLIGVETSKDRTEEIAREYSARDSRFRVFTGPRTGSCSVSRDTGEVMAGGEYVIFLDGDDTIAPGSLQRLHDMISARPGADIYPCAMPVIDDETGKQIELRDNYPADFSKELTGIEATLLTERHCGHPCPMLQLSVFRRRFLIDWDLKCIPGLRRQDSEFSPRALYRARRVIPLHEPFYNYRIRQNAVGSSAHGHGYFLKDWAIILRSLLAFHSAVSGEKDFDPRISACWARQWIPFILYFWFSPGNVAGTARKTRAETLETLFANGFGDFNALLAQARRRKRLAGGWVRAFVRFPALRGLIELLFRGYFRLANAHHGVGAHI